MSGSTVSPKVIQAFKEGGYVTVYEADAFLRLTRGTVKDDALSGRIPYTARPHGKKTKYVVRASDAEALYGIPG
jgi:hypothetical protein